MSYEESSKEKQNLNLPPRKFPKPAPPPPYPPEAKVSIELTESVTNNVLKNINFSDFIIVLVWFVEAVTIYKVHLVIVYKPTHSPIDEYKPTQYKTVTSLNFKHNVFTQVLIRPA